MAPVLSFACAVVSVAMNGSRIATEHVTDTYRITAGFLQDNELMSTVDVPD